MEEQELLYSILGVSLIMLAMMFYGIIIIKKIFSIYSEKIEYVQVWASLAEKRISDNEETLKTHEARFENLHERVMKLENLARA